MEETAQNALIKNEAAVPITKPEPPAPIYDADARNRFEFDVREGVKVFETAHVFEPLSDERYMQWLRQFKMKGTEENLDEQHREATCQLWNELIYTVENIEVEEGKDFRDLIPPPEKLEAMKNFLAVAIGADIVQVHGKRRLNGEETQTIATETYVNGQIVTQTHDLKQVTIEWQKKFSRIQAKLYKQEKIGGLRRKPQIEYVPQDHKFGELYDEMFVSQTGFANGRIPLRFKTTVIDHLFGERLSQKKSES